MVYYNRSLGGLRAVCLASQAFILHMSAGVSLCIFVWPYIIGALYKYVDFCTILRLYDTSLGTQHGSPYSGLAVYYFEVRLYGNLGHIATCHAWRAFRPCFLPP